MFIYICCAGGASSSLFCARLGEAINASAEPLTACVTDLTNALATPATFGAQADLVIVYGSVDAVRPATVLAFGRLFDVILVAPQVRYRTARLATLLAGYQTQVRDLNARIFGRLAGDAGLVELREMLIELDLARGATDGARFVTAAGDRDLTLLVYGASRSDPAIQQLTQDLLALDLHCAQTRFSLETLYEPPREALVDLRLVFGPQVTPANVAQVARRIDGVVRFTDAPAKPRAATWPADYKLPEVRLPRRLLNKGQSSALLDAWLAACQTATWAAEQTQARTNAAYETPPAPRPTRTILGLFTVRT
ncbi:hypothetical protein [Lacticaseibacillus daqingensis]|uniref:hypothetical protein n=1 Tax=Lacticaseibacillus daqingensis TaxID=2486014 RepID=UPI000F7B10D1|nr:hypothetical protein [Lacticaseibacillus daqingensis]